jgi:light-regulated signal transduction histidine kinase (bacteriophytochrome)
MSLKIIPIKIKKMEKFNQLKALLESADADAQKFYDKGNSSAGTRLRSALQEVKKLSQELRLEIQEMKNKAS